jgi:DNA repair protein RadA/Sms
LANQDVYINVTGGFELDERAADLPVVLAVLSSLHGQPLSSDLVAFGEVGLAGEVRGVAQVEKRVKEAQKLGFSQIVTAQVRGKSGKASAVGGIRFITELSRFFA